MIIASRRRLCKSRLQLSSQAAFAAPEVCLKCAWYMPL